MTDDGGMPSGGLGGRLRAHVERTHSKEVLEALGAGAGLYAFDRKDVKRPVLVSATGDVPVAKLALAARLGRHDTVGVDLVAALVDDLAVTGAEPLFVVDRLSTARLDPVHAEQVVAGVADGCAQAGVPLLGGRTAVAVQQAGRDQDDAGAGYDLAGFGVGVADARAMLGPGNVEEGDAVVALASTGLHGTGYEAAGSAVEGRDLHDDHGLMVQSLAEALLRPARVYAPHVLALKRALRLRAVCRVAEGGAVAALAPELPDGLGAVMDTRTCEVPRLFRLLQDWAGLDDASAWRTFNMGVGLLAVVEDGEGAVGFLRGRGVDAWVCGVVTSRPGVELIGLGRGARPQPPGR